MLRHRNERRAVLVEQLGELGEICERPRKTIDLVDNDNINEPRADIIEQSKQGRALHRTARQTTIIIGSRQKYPAFMFLAGDIGFAGIALGVQRVETLFQSLIRGFAGVDGAAEFGFGRLAAGSVGVPPGGLRC